MPPTAPKKWNAAIWIKSLSIVRGLLADSIINDAKVDASANIAQSKIASLVSDLAARAVKAANETISGTWTFSNPVTVATPTSNGHAVTKLYADTLSVGRRDKASVRAATTAALASYTFSANVITASANGALAAQDGVTLLAGEEFLVKNESGSNEKYNGPYVVTAVGDGSNPFVLTRRSDFDATAEVTVGSSFFVSEGTVNGNSTWTLITDAAITLNTTALTFTLTNQPIVSKAWYRIYGTATAAQTSITKNGGDPAIIDDYSVRVIIDHQELFPGEWEFVSGGGSINVYAMEEDQDYMVLYYA